MADKLEAMITWKQNRLMSTLFQNAQSLERLDLAKIHEI